MSIAYEKLTIANSFIFGKITLDPNNCRIILESLMNETIDEISSPQREKHLNIRADGKFIKLDLYVQASRNRIFDAEMQNKSRNIEKQKELLVMSAMHPRALRRSMNISILVKLLVKLC